MKSQYIIIEYSKEDQTMTFTGFNENLKPVTKARIVKITPRSKAGKKLDVINSTDTETFMLYYPTSSRLDLQVPELFGQRNNIEPNKTSQLNPNHYYALLPKKYLLTKDFDHFLKMVVGLTGLKDW